MTKIEDLRNGYLKIPPLRGLNIKNLRYNKIS